MNLEQTCSRQAPGLAYIPGGEFHNVAARLN